MAEAKYGDEFIKGEVEAVAGSMLGLMTTTLESATEAESEAYEAHAVLRLETH